ncbi:MAG: hypothetical protein ACF8TS_02750 [Maioricimonas sp. JB049]
MSLKSVAQLSVLLTSVALTPALVKADDVPGHPQAEAERGFAWKWPPLFRDSPMGARPHHGEFGSPGLGWRHFELPTARYGLWYRPNSMEPEDFRCRPRPFRPQGYGMPQHVSCYRMDYNPYVLEETDSIHGPSYYQRHPPLYPCGYPKCKCGKCLVKASGGY